MPMTPEEYADKELKVPGYTNEEPLHAPGSNQYEPEPEPAIDQEVLAIQREYNLILPLALRRAELETEKSKANFWNSLAAFITSLVG